MSKKNNKSALRVGVGWVKLPVFMILIFIPSLADCDINNFCLINQSENLTLRVWNETGRNYLTSYDAYIDIYSEGLSIVSNDTMSVTAEGEAWYELVDSGINSTGIYDYYLYAFYDDTAEISSGSYEVVEFLPNSVLDYVNVTITNSTSNLYQNIWYYPNRTLTDTVEVDYELIGLYVWNTTIRTLSSLGLTQVADAVWNYAVKSIDIIPIQTTTEDRYGVSTTDYIPSTQVPYEDPRYGSSSR